MTEVENGQSRSLDHEGFRELLEGMTSSISATRESIRKISQLDMNTKDGISLLSLKYHLMLSYCQSLSLLSVHRVLGHNLSTNDLSDMRVGKPNALQPFSSSDRGVRGTEPSDRVDSLIEKRIVLEKVKALESKMRYQIEKLLRLAEEPEDAPGKSIMDDPLAFRPNPQNLMTQDADESSGSDSSESSSRPRAKKAPSKAEGGVYRPPKLAPMPYTEENSKDRKKNQRAPLPSALAQLRTGADPYAETSSGLGGASLQSHAAQSGGGAASSRARELARMAEYEEENFTRLIMTKKEAKRRRRDEEDIALGGTGANLSAGTRGRGRRGVGLEDEFADVLRSVNRSGAGGDGGKSKRGRVGDGYEELRERGRKGDVLERAKTRMRDGGGDSMGSEDGPKNKKGRFEKALKRNTKKNAMSR